MSLLLHLPCPQCQGTVAVNREQLGTRVTCTQCLEEFVAVEPPSPSPPLPQRAEATPGGGRRSDPAAAVPPPTGREGWLTVDEDLTQEEELPSGPSRPTLERDYQFTLECHVCGTRLGATDAQIGSKIKCPDCHSTLVITEPPRHSRRPRTTRDSDDRDDDFRLSAPTEKPKYDWHLAEAEKELARAEEKGTPRRATPTIEQDAFRQAHEQYEAEEEARRRLPRLPLWNGVLAFLRDPNAWMFWLILAAVLFAEFAAIQGALEAAEGGPIAQFLSIVLRMFAAIGGAFFLAMLLVALVAIVQETSNASDRIEGWPGVNFMDWLQDMLFAGGAFFYAVMPAAALGQVLYLCGAPASLGLTVGIVGGLLGLTFLFPLALVSSLEVGTPFVPFSGPVWRSLGAAFSSWFVFLSQSLVLWLAVAGLAAARIQWHRSTLLNFLVAVLMVGLLLVYARLLGRLTWCAREALARLELVAEERPEA